MQQVFLLFHNAVVGSAVPDPVGPNPSFTIAALADRFADAIVVEHEGRAVEAAA